MVFKPLARPIRIVLRWQLIATVVLSLLAVPIWGSEGAVSAVLGGAVNMAAGWVYGWRLAQSEARTAGEALRAMLRAEAFKVLVIIAMLWLVLANYKEVVHVAFFAAFVITVGIFAAAIAVRDPDKNAPGSPGASDGR